MPKTFSFLFLSLTLSMATPEDVLTESVKPTKTSSLNRIKDMDCPALLAKAKEEAYVLKNLAALYANRKCKDFRFDFKKLSELEKRIFKMRFDEVDDSRKAELKDTDTIASLQAQYKKEKRPEERFNLFKKLRQKYRSAGRINDSMKLIKSQHAELAKLIPKQLKAKKPLAVSYDIYVESTQIYSKALWNNNKIDQATKVIEQTINDISGKHSTYSLHYLLGKIQEDKFLFESAINNFDKAMADYKVAKDKKLPIDRSFDPSRAEWSKAWIQYRHFEPIKTAETLKHIADTSADATEVSRANFFLAKIYKKMQKEDEAKKVLEENIKNDFFSFYSLASYHELGKKIPPIESIKTTSTIKFDPDLSFMSKSDKDFFFALIENEEIEMVDLASLIFTKNNTDYLNTGIHLAEKLQFYMPLFVSFTRLNNEQKKELFVKHSRLLFPEVYTDKVNEMSQKTNVSTSLIYSIMKQESGFNPESRSHANAMGLMQVIPRLAKTLAKKYKIEDYKSEEDLFNPLVNIELGTYELRDQVNKQNGQLSFVASAYNAGPNALKRWRGREPIQDMFEFIENIPYDETRSYVKIIARNMLFYERLAAPDKEHVFPIEFIKITEE